MESRRGDPSLSPHEMLLLDPGRLLSVYDQAAQEIVDVARFEGHFEGWDAGDLRWPSSQGADLAALEAQHRLVTTVYDRVPERREHRLAEAYEQFREAIPAYHRANLIYLQVKRRFLDRGAGSDKDFIGLYQGLYVEVLAKGDPVVLDAGESALQRAKITRAPMLHAQTVAEALASVDPGDDPRWSDLYAYEVDGVKADGSLREILRDVARDILAYIAAGELVTTRYNTYTNFAWFGSSVWKVIMDGEMVLHHLNQVPAPGGSRKGIEALTADVRREQAMMVEFLQAHRENPAKLKPEGYWYGHQYTYLTRDMIDLARRLAARANRLAKDLPAESGVRHVEVPPLLLGKARGRFLEYPHVGPTEALPGWRRVLRLGRWVIPSCRLGRRKLKLGRAAMDAGRRKALAWEDFLGWGRTTVRIFGIDVKISIDPAFSAAAEALDLRGGKQKILFLPTHQSLLDHPVMYYVLQSPELLRAMGWERPVPCVILARTRLASAGVRIGSWSMTMFGVSAGEFDRLLEDVDGYVTLDRSRDAGPTTQRLIHALDAYPGLTYPVGTTIAFDVQSPPLQHALFAVLPQDVIIIPIAVRGIHALWPKCPKGNLHISPGKVEVVVSPPMPGETTLLPRRRTLRTQLESAGLFQAVHITTLLNPEPLE